METVLCLYHEKVRESFPAVRGALFFGGMTMGFLDWLGISARDAPQVTDNVRDSGQTFVFGKADSGEKVDEKSAMQIATVYI